MKRLTLAIAFIATLSGCNITVRMIHEHPLPSYSTPLPHRYNEPDTTWYKYRWGRMVLDTLPSLEGMRRVFDIGDAK